MGNEVVVVKFSFWILNIATKLLVLYDGVCFTVLENTFCRVAGTVIIVEKFHGKTFVEWDIVFRLC